MNHYPTTFHTPRADLRLPVYLPDATFGVVRAADAQDLAACGLEAVVMNTFHLMQKPGSSTIGALGGLHKMSGWNGIIVTDSGGFQAYSLIRQNEKFGKLTDKGITFKPEGSSRSFQLTPEKCIQLQLAYDTDVVITLDDCTHVDAPYEEQKKAVQRTIDWAKRCKTEYDRLIRQKKLDESTRPRVFGVIQGGGDYDLRKRCANELLEIGFDGFGYGGWPLDAENNLLVDILGYVRELIPAEYPLHALGVGHPENVLAGFDLGYGIFDCAMPTRDARHGRLNVFTQPAEGPSMGLDGKWYRYLYIHDERHIKADEPLSPYCDCPTCTHYSVGYLRHLFKMNEMLYYRLATLHNLRFMTQLTERIQRREGSDG
ncbi:MAG: queuine tRNA-ribosyltransferase family protein [Anaerolineaceae bacterium]|nr:queuine tRNA-ribosyltransferase family protein [Anaerolineaceae bacterium]